ncbi:MAG TPA: diguanylate cyclase response regulator [Phycisphaerales bacterium]|nr:diguanylate cyclase response regulator [Phycisphaerales bacterium]
MPHTKEQQKPILLLIDDSPSIHRLLAFKLKNEGLEFLAAFDSTEGVELAQSHQPSLILLDLNMPVVDGFQTMRALKECSQTISIPVIVLSGTTSPEDKVRAFELGAMDFVCKPFDIHELRARINSAIRISRLMKMLEMRAQVDGLTGLWNRAYFNERLASELAEASRNNKHLALVLCDLDHFKKLNDTFGHPAGDAVLQGFAEVLTTELRAYDIPCRYGGEEFVIILPDTDRDEARQVAERIRAALEAKGWPKFPDIHATASFGLTTAGLAGKDDPASWIQAADQMLYQAKHAGRNRVEVFSGPPSDGKAHLALAS